MKKLLSITLLAVLLLGLLSCGQKELPNADLTIIFMETGKSDAILIKHKGTNILIDTGYAANAHEIENTLSREGVEKIDYMILTHYDKDHIGSAPTLMHTYEIGMIYAPDFVVETNEYASLMTTIQQMEIPLTKLNERVTISLSSGATLKLSPTELTPTDDNNQSIICALNWDDFGCLFLADALKDRLVEYAAEDQTTYDVVKLPHHGNYYKKLEEYMRVVKPTHAVVCAGEAREVEEQLITMCNTLGISLFRTDAGGVRLTYNQGDATYQIGHP